MQSTQSQKGEVPILNHSENASIRFIRQTVAEQLICPGGCPGCEEYGTILAEPLPLPLSEHMLSSEDFLLGCNSGRPRVEEEEEELVTM